MLDLLSATHRRWLWLATALAPVAACGRGDAPTGLGPDPTALIRVSVARPSGPLVLGDSLELVAYGHRRNGDSLVVLADWTARAGVITGGGWYYPTEEGRHAIRGVARAQPTLADSAFVDVISPLDLAVLDLSPKSAAAPNGRTIPFTVKVVVPDSTVPIPAVQWSSTGGAIDSTGLFRATGAPGAYQVTARLAGRTASGSTTVTVLPASLERLAITPTTVAITVGTTAQFAAAAEWSDGSSALPPLDWSATGGTVTSTGRFTAGLAAGSYVVRARSAAHDRVDSALVGISIPPPQVTSIVLNPTTVVVNPTATKLFTVTGTWSNGSTAAPTVTYSATGGTITPSGLFTAGTTGGTFRVIATGAGGIAADTSTVTIRPPRPLLGIHSDLMWNLDPAFHARAIDAARSVRAEVARVGLMWTWIEYTRGHQDWTVPDRVIQGLVDAGIEPLLVVFGSPAWANGVSPTGDPYFYLQVPTDPAAFQAWVAEYRDFIGQAARRYHGRVTKWELWNEPNDGFFWRPSPRIDQYATWFAAVRQAILADDPNAEIASGGLNQLVVSYPGNISGRVFLRGLYTSQVFPEIVAIHPYSNQGQSPDQHVAGAQNFDDIDPMLQVMAANGQGHRRLWVTEWGWSTAQVGEAQQASYLARSLTLLTTRYSTSVWVATYFSEYDSAPYSFGLFRTGWVERPAADTFRQALLAASPAR